MWKPSWSSRIPGASLPRSITASISRRPDAGVLGVWIDRDRADAADRVALVEEVGADDLSADLGHDAPDLGMGNPDRHHHRRRLDRGEVALEAVIVVDVPEGLEDDAREVVSVGGLGGSEGDFLGGRRLAIAASPGRCQRKANQLRAGTGHRPVVLREHGRGHQAHTLPPHAHSRVCRRLPAGSERSFSYLRREGMMGRVLGRLAMASIALGLVFCLQITGAQASAGSRTSSAPRATPSAPDADGTFAGKPVYLGGYGIGGGSPVLAGRRPPASSATASACAPLRCPTATTCSRSPTSRRRAGSPR